MAISLNGTTYNGSLASPANPFPPSSITRAIEKAGIGLKMASGVHVFVGSGAARSIWTLTWEMAHATTKTAILTLCALTTTFVFVDEVSSSHTVHLEEEPASIETAFTSASGALFYNITITLVQTT